MGRGITKTKESSWLFRFIVHSNIAFSITENWFFRHFLDEIRPSYQAPSRYVLSHSIMDSEIACVQIENIACLKDRKRLAYLLDGWKIRFDGACTADPDDQDYLAGPESITDEELMEEFDRFERETREADQLRENDGAGASLLLASTTRVGSGHIWTWGNK
ncbi:hypothetical protein F4604DRAFT_136767 [Suillus subluteus]|nr:hypothetical protein F4604DRAFT_136767 [Suillus subluteus]